MSAPCVVLILALAASWTVTIAGHHSLSAYDTGRRVTVQGTIAHFQFVNPHPILVVEARDGGGRTQRWEIELDNRRELSSAGVDGTTLKPGERVIVAVNPGRDGARIGYLQRLDRPADGLRLEQVGSSPSLLKPGAALPITPSR